MIGVERTGSGDPYEFLVTVTEGGGETRHRVTLSHRLHQQLVGEDHSPEACVEAAFRFLLDREPKESILGRFDITVITRYFPEFDEELPRYLRRDQRR